MSSTNKTTNYNLSQYVGEDKPTYLGDYNGDMLKIDTQMKNNNNLASSANTAASNASEAAIAANTKATNNETKIGTLTNLTTTEKTNLVGAINEVNTSSVGNTGAIGTLSNLLTTDKTNLVSAINEVFDGTVEVVSDTKYTALKFKNGILITFSSQQLSGINITTQTGSLYRTDNLAPFDNYPVQYYSAPTIIYNAGAGCYVCPSTPGTSAPGTLQIFRGSSVSGAIIDFWFVALGRWKA